MGQEYSTSCDNESKENIKGVWLVLMLCIKMKSAQYWQTIVNRDACVFSEWFIVSVFKTVMITERQSELCKMMQWSNKWPANSQWSLQLAYWVHIHRWNWPASRQCMRVVWTTIGDRENVHCSEVMAKESILWQLIFIIERRWGVTLVFARLMPSQGAVSET